MSGNSLNYGDNLAVLREHVGDESVDLVYLDPLCLPFTHPPSNRGPFPDRAVSRSKATVLRFSRQAELPAVAR